MLPSLFISHGAPTLALEKSEAHDFLAGLLDRLEERPAAILVASAHWESGSIRVSAPEANRTIHDFYGFPQDLYDLHYGPPAAPVLAGEAVAFLRAAGFEAATDGRRGLDHGAWIPLRIARPQADIPVAQVSVQPRAGPAHHLRMGEALAPLRRRGVLIVGSGSFTHDLSEYGRYRDVLRAPEPDWVTRFADWADNALAECDADRLIDYRAQAPHARKNHPTEEHLLPLFVALGAGGGRDARATRLHSSTEHGVLRMDAYAFGTPEGDAANPAPARRAA